MKTKILTLAAIAGAFVSTNSFASGPVTAKYYANGNWTDTGSSITFTGNPYQTDYISDIYNYANTNQNPVEDPENTDPNFPSPNVYFGADFTANINVASSGTYSVGIATDDTGYLFIDGNLIVDEPGYHTPYNSFVDVFLNAGVNSLELQTDNGGGPCCAAAEVFLPNGITYVSPGVPEPATWAMMLAGFAMVGFAMRRRGRLMEEPRVRFAF